LAEVKNKVQRDFRLQSGANSPSLDFSKIKVGKVPLNGEIATLVDNYRKSGSSFRYDKKTVEKAIDNHDIKAMRRISNHFFDKSGIYSRLCRYMAALFRYDWFITPVRNDSKIKDDKVVEGWIKSCMYLENSKLKQSFGRYALDVVKEGCYYGYMLDHGTATFTQKLPADYCRCRYEIDGNSAVEFNLKFFDDAFADNAYKLRVLKTFPKEIQKAYVSFKSGNLPRDFSGDDTGWFLLDPAKTVRFNLYGNDAPLFMSAIPAILDLEDAKKLDHDKMVQQLLRIIIQKMPLDKNGDLIFDVAEANALHNNVVAMVGDAIGVDVLTTFADVEVADLSDNSSVSSVDHLEIVERSLFNEAGVSQKQFNTDGQTALDKSIANDESTMMDLIYQFADYAERLLAPFNKNSKKLYYKVSMLPTTVYNYKDISKMYKEQTQIGFSKLLPQIALGHSQSDVINTAIFENQILNLNDLFTPPQMSSTISSSNKATTSNTGNNNANSEDKGEASGGEKGGRPEKPDDEKSEKTLRNIESSG
jgi:hypothetical protein